MGFAKVLGRWRGHVVLVVVLTITEIVMLAVVVIVETGRVGTAARGAGERRRWMHVWVVVIVG